MPRLPARFPAAHFAVPIATLALLLVGPVALPAQGSAVAGAPAVPPPPAPQSATLLPGDHVRVVVWRNDELSGEFTVRADSTLSHPLYRSVNVVGVSVTELERRLAEHLSLYESTPRIVVEPLFRVAVGGEVRSPNLYSLPRETTVSQAIALAGGLSERGRLDRVKLLRDGREILLDLTKADAGWASMPIRSGDQVLVSRRRDLLRETIVPIASLAGAAAAIINVARRR